jgi:biotin carboxylase
LIVGHRDYFNIPNTFIPSATIFTDAESANSKLEKNIKDVNLSLIEGMGLSFGITHAEFIYNEEQDKIYLVEIAARGGGVFISSDLIPMACGVNANELLVKDALNEEISLENTKLTKGASAYFCYLVPKGVIAKIKGINEVKKIPNVSKAFFDNIFVGMETVDITNKASRKGPILVKGETKEECYQTLNAIKEKLRIDIITDNGVEHIIWN